MQYLQASPAVQRKTLKVIIPPFIFGVYLQVLFVFTSLGTDR